MSNLACASPCWLIYDILVGSWGGVLNESITLGSILLSIYRYGWKAMGIQIPNFKKIKWGCGIRDRTKCSSPYLYK